MKPILKNKTKDRTLLNYKIDLYLFTLLLIFTPFLMLINFLQQAIGQISNFKFNFYFFELPAPVTAGAVVVAILLYTYVRKTNLIKMAGWIMVGLMIIIGHNSTDYYMNLSYFELQQNWHYIAYGLFSLINYRLMKAQNASDVKIIWNTWARSLLVSGLDEIIQVFLTYRIFDPCDLAKDSWGTIMGLIIIFIIIFNGEILKQGWKIHHKNIKDYFRHPVTGLFLLLGISYLFLYFSSLLTDSDYLLILVFIILAYWIIFFAIVHFSQFRIGRLVIIFIFTAIIVSIVFGNYKNGKGTIQSKRTGLIVYKGLPVPFFDVMIFPDGHFRLVDKKTDFTNVDKQLIFDKNPDILLMGTGKEGKGGNSLGDNKEVQFIFNSKYNKAIQLVKLKTPEACRTFNRLKKSGYNVMFIIHNN